MDELPPEVQLHVIRFLSFRDKLSLRQTSSGLLSLVNTSSVTLRWRVNIAALRGIAAALQREDSLFCCGGTTRACRPLTLFFKGKGSSCGFVTFPTDPSPGTRTSGSLQGLLDCCSSASAPTTKRKGQTLLHLSPSDFSINFHLEEHDFILEKVKLMMSPNSHKVRAELYQLSIIFPSYNKEEDEEEEEEEQEKEKDKQEGNLHPHLGHGRENKTDLLFGLLEVCLPKAFQGGKLEVQHSQQPWKAVFDLSSRVGDQDHQKFKQEKEKEEEEEEVTSSEIKWAAYHLSGCLNRVLPVTQGYRVSLVYKLYHHPLPFPPQSQKLYRHPLHLPSQSETQQGQEPMPPKKKKRKMEDSPQQQTTVSLDLFSLLQQKLEAIVVDAGCLAEEGVTLAFHCQYSYSCEAVAQTPSLNSLLKAFDALLHETATRPRVALRTSLGCFQPLCIESFAESDFPTLFFGFETFPQGVDVVRKMPKGNWDDCQRYVADNYDVCELRDVLLPLDDGDDEEEEKTTNESERKQRERLLLKEVSRSFGEKLTAAEARNLAWDLLVMEETEEECLGDLPTKAVQWCNLNRGRLPYEQHHFAGRILFAVGAVPGSGRRPTTSPRTAAFTAEPVLYIQVPPNK